MLLQLYYLRWKEGRDRSGFRMSRAGWREGDAERWMDWERESRRNYLNYNFVYIIRSVDHGVSQAALGRDKCHTCHITGLIDSLFFLPLPLSLSPSTCLLQSSFLHQFKLPLCILHSSFNPFAH